MQRRHAHDLPDDPRAREALDGAVRVGGVARTRAEA